MAQMVSFTASDDCFPIRRIVRRLKRSWRQGRLPEYQERAWQSVAHVQLQKSLIGAYTLKDARLYVILGYSVTVLALLGGLNFALRAMILSLRKLTAILCHVGHEISCKI